jgi:3-deoxy-D-manno-octulosonic-acid transferase
MNIFQFAYNVVPLALAPIVIPGIWWYAKRDPQKRSVLAQRLGHDLDHLTSAFNGDPKIWIHAVSVGEVKAAESVIDALDAVYQTASFLLTTTTTTGQQFAHRQLGTRATVCYAPVDLWTAVRRFLSAFRPDLLICLETEIWPNWIVKAHQTGMKVVFLNGRLSSRSIRSYMKIRPLLRPVLEKVDAFSMISNADAQRIIALGAPAQRVHVNGNVKTDIRAEHQNDHVVDKLKGLFAVDEQTPVFIGGSVRGAEVGMLLDVYSQLATLVPGLLFIIAPRHIENSSVIERLARERGICRQRRTALGKPGVVRTAPLVILDTIGELRDVYSIASVVFGGASLVPLGGQNVLEAAVWAKPILFGPHMDDFAEARTLLERCGGGICIKDAGELTARAAHLLAHPGEARRLGNLAKRAMLTNQGAAKRHARVVFRLLPGVPQQN